MKGQFFKYAQYFRGDLIERGETLSLKGSIVFYTYHASTLSPHWFLVLCTFGLIGCCDSFGSSLISQLNQKALCSFCFLTMHMNCLMGIAN